MPFDTSLLDDALDRRKANNEQQRQIILAQLREWLDRFGAQYGIEQAYIFGSLSRPSAFTERSDVDLAVESIDSSVFFEVMSTLMTLLSRDVDLIRLNQCHFAHRIREQGILWKSQPSLS